MQSKVAIIIPMRIASTRLPGKQHALIGGRPLIHHVLDIVLKSKIRPVYVACDSQLHFDLIKQYGGVDPIMTDPALASGSDRIHAASQVLKRRGEEFDIIVNVQGDMLFFDPKIIDDTVEMMQKNQQFDMGTCAAKSTDPEWINPPSHVKVVRTKSQKALYFSRNVIPLDSKEALIHIGIYAFRSNALDKYVSFPQSALELQERLEQLRALENDMNIGVCLVNSIPLSVDMPEDLELARQRHAEGQK